MYNLDEIEKTNSNILVIKIIFTLYSWRNSLYVIKQYCVVESYISCTGHVSEIFRI